MDEHPAAGVFFGNNSVLSGAGGGPGPGIGGRSLQPQPGVEGETQRPQYNIPGILHFLQHEWARFEVERTQWEVDRAELQHHPVCPHKMLEEFSESDGIYGEE